MYKVIYPFLDKMDGNHFYRVGDTYPRDGYEPEEKRINHLRAKANPTGTSVIEYVEEKLVPDEDVMSRAKINSMSTKNLKKLAKENGFMGADHMMAFELKDALIEKLGL